MSPRFSVAPDGPSGFSFGVPLITTDTRIKAPAERVFDLSRSIELHLKSAGDSEERVAAGRESGLLEKGDEITWEGSHLRFRQKLHVKITELNRATSFTDEMVNGPFARMKHAHLFKEDGKFTVMRDEFDYKSRGGPIAWLIENSFLTAHIRRFLADRNTFIKQVAESEEWQKYLPDASPQD